MRSETMKNLRYYLELPYTVIIRRDEDGDYVARIDELPGCAAHGKNTEDALEALEEAKELWITDCLDRGDPVPEPMTEESLPSGKWVQRVPRSLHKKLVSLAKRENVSLNQFVATILAEAVGAQRADQPDFLRRAVELLQESSFGGSSDFQNTAPVFLHFDSGHGVTGSAWPWPIWGPEIVASAGSWRTVRTSSDWSLMINQPQAEEVEAHG
jgi:antitoxin HicB